MSESRITSDEVRHIAALARLRLSDDEVETTRVQLDAVLGYMAELDATDVQGVEPTYHSIPVTAPLRPDEPQPSLPRDDALAAAPETYEGGFAVPRVVEGEE